ncbi:MAG: hypothetical protein ACC628_02130 [Pirellulaceae bacterium]
MVIFLYSAGMDEVKKRILLDLFVSPWAVLPVAGGLSAWMVSWAVGGSSFLNMAGLAGVLGGVGALASRLIVGLEDITHKAYSYLHEQRRAEQEAALDELDQRLSLDRDDRTQESLRELRQIYQIFQEQSPKGRITGSSHLVLERVGRLFKACVKQLEQSYELWRNAEHLSGEARQALLADRDDVVEEVVLTIRHLGKSVEQLHALRGKESESELATLREELDETMRVARRAEQRMASLGKSINYEPSEFE